MSFLPIRVLVVEDHPFKQLVATQAFQEAGCDSVLGVDDVSAALQLLDHTGAVDIVLCALKEEGMPGLATLELLGRSHRFKALIICSAIAPDLQDAIERMVGMLGVSVLGYVDVPVRAGSITPLLSRYLETTLSTKHAPQKARYRSVSQAGLEQAIAGHELKAFFQPKFNLATGEVASLEVLARWQHPQYGVLGPADFLPQVSQFGLMDKLFFALLDQGLAFLQTAQTQGQVLSLAFNLDAQQLSNESLLAHLASALERYAIPASCLTFEITESGLLEVSPRVLETLIRLRMMGAGLSIDDFGIGYSSLERLCLLPFTEIKLDACFVRDLDRSRRNRAVISSTLALAQALDMAVVVEGIEHESQRQHLLNLGCLQGQGYLCARPMDATRTLSWLAIKLASHSTL